MSFKKIGPYIREVDKRTASKRTYCHKAVINFSRAFELKHEDTAIQRIRVLLRHENSKTTAVYPHISKNRLKISKPIRSTY